MSTSFKNFNYLIKEQPDTIPKELVAEIIVFFAKQYGKKIIVITKGELEKDSAGQLFSLLDSSERRLITFMFCKNYQAVLDKLLEIDSSMNIPKVLIIESLHQWYNNTTSIDKIPSIYTTIIAAAQDLVNVNSRTLNEPCFSFITSQPDELPTNIIELFYGSPITGEKDCLVDVFEEHKNRSRKS